MSALPAHVGIIMDGNGRWAQQRGRPRLEGHHEGANRVRDVTRAARRMGLSALTLYAFSSQNWERPAEEVAGLMALLADFLEGEREEIMNNGIRLRAIGRIASLPTRVRRPLARLCSESAGNTGMVLTLALSYGGREDLVDAVNVLREKETGPVDAAMLDRALSTFGLPELDLIIRTGGERRLSNFMLWQAAYAELVFVDSHWPEFGAEAFESCIEVFAHRQRRFGKLYSSVLT